jgi:hypothetical protein
VFFSCRDKKIDLSTPSLILSLNNQSSSQNSIDPEESKDKN